MPASNQSQRDTVERDATITSVRLPRAATAPALARRGVRRALASAFPAGRVSDLVLLTSEVVTNAVEHSRTGSIEISVASGAACTRVEISNPGPSWGRGPQLRRQEPGATGGWGLFLVEQLSDRWGASDGERSVWFEFDHPADEIRASFPLLG